MAIAKIREHGQITIPKPIRESLGLKKGDIVDARLEGDCVVITPRKMVSSQDWEKLLQVMNSVHEQNKGIREEQVYQDVERAFAELRQEEYGKQKKLNVVLDSVVAVSAFLTDGLTADLVSQCQENVNLFTAEVILQEIHHVLLKKSHIRNRYKYSADTVEAFIDNLRKTSTVIPHLPEIRVIECDPKDDMIIACALVVSADYHK